jgi:bile acid-coenzyme A ligase
MQPTPLAVRLRRLADADPDRPAVTCGADTLTRRQLDEDTNALARTYAGLGVTARSLVTIGLPNGIEFLLAAVAVWKLGATPQPISYRMPERERDAVLAVADPALVVGPAATGFRHVPAGFRAAADTSPLPPVIAPALKAPTSGGSTGTPKIIVSGEPAAAEVLDQYANLFGMPRDGVHLVAGPLYHNAPFMMAAAALYTGSHVVVLPRFDAAELLDLVARHGVQWMFLVPTMMHRIWRLPEQQRAAADISSLVVVLHGASPCPPWLKVVWLDWLGPQRLYELYAGTEAQAGCLISGAEWLAHPGSVGQVRAGQIRILDAGHHDVPTGGVGEIWMRPAPGGPPTYRYLGATTTVLEGGWESLGDLGRFDADGYLYLADRKLDMILVGGANVFPAEIEAAIDEYPDVLSSCVIGLPDDEYGNTVHAVVQVAGPVDIAALLVHLADRLTPAKLPRTVELVDYPLRDDAGKVRRSEVRARRLASAT